MKEAWRKKRPYIIVAAFVVGMLLTPPDIFSQTLLALPVWVLFELGLYCCRFMKNRKQMPTLEWKKPTFKWKKPEFKWKKPEFKWKMPEFKWKKPTFKWKKQRTSDDV